MTDLTPSIAQLKFLRTFFGEGNALRWSEFESDQMAQNVKDLLSVLATDFLDKTSPVTLPRVSDNGKTVWYFCARHPRQSQMLKEQLESFLGPSYTDFRGQRVNLNLNDPVELAVNKQFGTNVFRLRVLEDKDRNVVRERVFLMRSLRDRAEGRSYEQIKPIGRLLRDLEMALFAKNAPSAWRIHEQLRTRGRLSSRNLLFLQVIVLACFKQWQQILALPQCPSLMNVRRPLRVSHALLKANYAVNFQGFENEKDVAGCIAAFMERKPSLGTLFQSTANVTDASVLKSLILNAAYNLEDGDERLEKLAAQYRESEFFNGQWVEAICRFARENKSIQSRPQPSPATYSSIFETAKRACERNDFVTGLTLLLQCAPTVDVLRQTLVCAYELNELGSTSQTLDYIHGTPREMRDEALAMRSAAQWYQTLCEETGQPQKESSDPSTEITLPTNWHLWLHRLNQDAEWPEAIEILRLGMGSWKVEAYRDETTQRRQLTDALTASRSESAEASLRLAMPHLLIAFIPNDNSVREFKTIYMHFALMLSLDDEIGSDDLTALAILTEAILKSDPVASNTKNELQDLMEILETAWGRMQSSHHLDWTLTILDLLIAFNVSHRTPIDGYLNSMVSSFRQWNGRVRLDQWDFLHQLFYELGQLDYLANIKPEESQETDSEDFDGQSLSGKSIAIYTLTERIGRQAEQMILNRFEGVKVHLLHVKASTDRLVQLSESADIFIVNTWDAKHAATGAIKQNRGNEKTTLVPEGKSAGSLVRSLIASIGNQDV